MAVHCVAAEHGGLIKKEKEKKEISWVKLKAFPTNVGRPNNKWFLMNFDEKKHLFWWMWLLFKRMNATTEPIWTSMLRNVQSTE